MSDCHCSSEGQFPLMKSDSACVSQSCNVVVILVEDLVIGLLEV